MIRESGCRFNRVWLPYGGASSWCFEPRSQPACDGLQPRVGSAEKPGLGARERLAGSDSLAAIEIQFRQPQVDLDLEIARGQLLGGFVGCLEKPERAVEIAAPASSQCQVCPVVGSLFPIALALRLIKAAPEPLLGLAPLPAGKLDLSARAVEVLPQQPDSVLVG